MACVLKLLYFVLCFLMSYAQDCIVLYVSIFNNAFYHADATLCFVNFSKSLSFRDIVSNHIFLEQNAVFHSFLLRN